MAEYKTLSQLRADAEAAEEDLYTAEQSGVATLQQIDDMHKRHRTAQNAYWDAVERMQDELCG